LFLSFFLSHYSLLISLLSLLVYLGSLMVLFAYMWIFIINDSRASSSYSVLLFFFLFSLRPLSPTPSSVTFFLLPTSLLIFLVCILFWAMVVVIFVLDLSLGGFSA